MSGAWSKSLLSLTRIWWKFVPSVLLIIASLLLLSGFQEGAVSESAAALSPNSVSQYVSPETCQGCHAEIYATFQESGMARSFFRPSPDNVIEDYTADNRFFHAPSNRHYRMVQRKGKFYQQRYRLDSHGNETNMFEQEVSFVIGSGNHARTYLNLSKGGLLTELPITWYSQEHRWAMSPGYDHPRHDDFSREVSHNCIFCHNAYPQFSPGAERFGRKSIFPQEMPSGIDCQRCHGPGLRHVQLASGSGVREQPIREAIVNPARLTSELQMDVCMQCHLEPTSAGPRVRRFGRSVYSFRPGERLADYIVHFDLVDLASGKPDDRFEIDSAAYRLRQSACFTESSGRMICTTCHNPHRKLQAQEAIQHYRARCLSCHHEPSRTHHPVPTSQDCVSCHMPKRRTEDVVQVVMTEHRIQARIPPGNLLAPLPEDHSPKRQDIILYDVNSVPHSERQVYLGIAETQFAATSREGLVRLKRVLDKSPLSIPEPYLQLALGEAKIGRLAEAENSLRRVLDLDPQAAIARFNLAEVLRKRGNLEEAARQYRLALELDVDYSEAHNSLGIVLKRQQPSLALEHFKKSLVRNPLLVDAYVNLAITLNELGDPDQAADQLDRALQINPDDAEANLNVGLLQARVGQLPEAIEAFKRSILARPDDAAAHYNLGVAFGELGQLQDACRAFEQAIRIKPDDGRAHHNLGMTYRWLDRFEEAIASLKYAVRVNPNNPESHLQLGLAYLSAGQKKLAREEYQILKALDNEKATRLLSEIGSK